MTSLKVRFYNFLLGRTSFLLVGDDPGESKIKKVTERKYKIDAENEQQPKNLENAEKSRQKGKR